MQQQQVESSVPVLQQVKDPRPEAKPERGLRCEIEIDCIPMQQLIGGAFLVPTGKSRCTVFKKDLPAILAQVEPEPQLLALAEDTWRRKRDAELQRVLGTNPQDAAGVTARFHATYNHSVAAEFRQMTGETRDMYPFRSVTIITPDLPELVDEERLDTERVHAKAIGQAVAEGLRLARAEGEADIQTRIDAAVAKALAAQQSSGKK